MPLRFIYGKTNLSSMSPPTIECSARSDDLAHLASKPRSRTCCVPGEVIYQLLVLRLPSVVTPTSMTGRAACRTEAERLQRTLNAASTMPPSPITARGALIVIGFGARSRSASPVPELGVLTAIDPQSEFDPRPFTFSRSVTELQNSRGDAIPEGETRDRRSRIAGKSPSTFVKWSGSQQRLQPWRSPTICLRPTSVS